MPTLEEVLIAIGTQPLERPVQLPATVIDVLERSHPTHKANIETWDEIQDVVFDGVKDNVDKYIPKGSEEDPKDHKERLHFARFKGEMKPLIGRLVGAIFKRPPTRPEQLKESFGEFIDNVDGSKSSMTRFMEDRAKEILAFGAVVILVDRPPTNEEGMVFEQTSKGFAPAITERALGEQEFTLAPYTLNQLLDWDHDATGEPHWIKLVEVTRRASPFGREQSVTVYRIYDRMSWRVFEVREEMNSEGKKERTAWLVAQGDHMLGMVPIAIPFYEKSGHFDYTSPFVNAYHFDIEEFRNDADLQWDTWLHAHPTFKDGRSADKQERVAVGPGSKVDVDPQHQEDVGYIEFPTTATQELRKNKEEAVSGRRRVAGIDTLSGSEDPQAAAASGRSRVVSFTISEERVMSRGATACEKGENRIFEIVARWSSGVEDPSITETFNDKSVQYPKKFGMDDLGQLIDHWHETRNEINSDTYDREMQKQIVTQALGDISPDNLLKIQQDIESNELLKGMSPMGSTLEKPDLEQEATAQDAEEAFESADRLERLSVRDLEAMAR